MVVKSHLEDKGLTEESQHALCSLLSYSAHWPSATPQWCTPALSSLTASIGWWMRKNDCDISYRFHIKVPGSNAAPDTLIPILAVRGQHKNRWGLCCSDKWMGWPFLFFLNGYQLSIWCFPMLDGIPHGQTLCEHERGELSSFFSDIQVWLSLSSFLYSDHTAVLENDTAEISG